MTPEDVREIKVDIKELIKQGAVHNELLRTHEARSLELKSRQDLLQESVSKRLLPIERTVTIVNVVLAGLGTAATVMIGKLIVASFS